MFTTSQRLYTSFILSLDVTVELYCLTKEKENSEPFKKNKIFSKSSKSSSQTIHNAYDSLKRPFACYVVKN